MHACKSQRTKHSDLLLSTPVLLCDVFPAYFYHVQWEIYNKQQQTLTVKVH